MLELPESTTVAFQIKEVLLGKRIAAVQAGQSPHGFGWYFCDPAQYPDMLMGKEVTDAYPVAGLVELAAQDMRLVFSDGVNLRYLKPGTPLPSKHQLYLGFEDGSGLVCTVQMYGGMMAFPAGSYDNPYYNVAKEKPHPLSEAFNEAYFRSIIPAGGPKLSAKALLATKQRIPGLGNGVLQDILWNARINPQTKVAKLSEVQLATLFCSIKMTLREMTDEGGRDTEKTLFGAPGGYRSILSSKTQPYPCRRCGGGILRKAYLGGTVYVCPVCQPL